jgi:hypothetical protein
MKNPFLNTDGEVVEAAPASTGLALGQAVEIELRRDAVALARRYAKGALAPRELADAVRAVGAPAFGALAAVARARARHAAAAEDLARLLEEQRAAIAAADEAQATFTRAIVPAPTFEQRRGLIDVDQKRAAAQAALAAAVQRHRVAAEARRRVEQLDDAEQAWVETGNLAPLERLRTEVGMFAHRGDWQ